MSIVELILLAVALSMDAFAISICKGLSLRRLKVRHMVIVGLYFGVAQAVMPAIGYFLGQAFSDMVSAFTPWIAFVLLAFIGAKMLWETFHDQDNEETCGEKIEKLDHKELFLMAVATSIDALAVGVTFAFLEVDLLSSALLIGCTTFLISAAGVRLGSVVGNRFEKQANVLGGVILICLGVKILVESFLG